MHRKEFLESVLVLDTETTHLNPDIAEIVEIAGASYSNVSWSVESFLLGSKNPIPPEASAKNNISNRMIHGLPCFHEQVEKINSLLKINDTKYWIAHNCEYDLQILESSYKRNNFIELSNKISDKKSWICTYRLAQHILHEVSNDIQYGLNYLRYRLDLMVPDDYTSHRANADTLTCAILLEFLVDYALETNQLVESPSLGEDLHELCWSPIKIKTWPFGKHKGKLLSEIDKDYYRWGLENLNALNKTHIDYNADLTAAVLEQLKSP